MAKEKTYRIIKNNKEEIKSEFETRQFLSPFATPAFMNMFSNLSVLEGMFHYETMSEIIRLS